MRRVRCPNCGMSFPVTNEKSIKCSMCGTKVLVNEQNLIPTLSKEFYDESSFEVKKTGFENDMNSNIKNLAQILDNVKSKKEINKTTKTKVYKDKQTKVSKNNSALLVFIVIFIIILIVLFS